MITRTFLAFVVGFVGVVLATPILAIGFVFWAVAFLTRACARGLEARFLPWQELIAFDPAVGWKPRPNLNTHGVADDVFHLTTDSQGWRGQTPLAQSDIVVFGDSYAFCYGVDDRASFSELDPHPRVKAIGAPGYSMVQEFLLMRQLAAQLTGKLVVWFIYVGNDLYDNLMPDMASYRAPFVRRVDGTDDWEIFTNHINLTKWRYSYKPRLYLTILAQLCRPCFLSQRVYAACDFLIREGNALCRQVGAELVVMTIPDSKQLSPEGRKYLTSLLPDPAGFDADFPDQQIRHACNAWGVPFVALKDHLNVHDYKASDVHWNEQGHRRVRKLLVDLYHEHLSRERAVSL